MTQFTSGMKRTEITIHIIESASGVSFFWELRGVAGVLITDCDIDGEYGCFASFDTAFADAAKVAGEVIKRNQHCAA